MPVLRAGMHPSGASNLSTELSATPSVQQAVARINAAAAAGSGSQRAPPAAAVPSPAASSPALLVSQTPELVGRGDRPLPAGVNERDVLRLQHTIKFTMDADAFIAKYGHLDHFVNVWKEAFAEKFPDHAHHLENCSFNVKRGTITITIGCEGEVAVKA